MFLEWTEKPKCSHRICKIHERVPKICHLPLIPKLPAKKLTPKIKLKPKRRLWRIYRKDGRQMKPEIHRQVHKVVCRLVRMRPCLRVLDPTMLVEYSQQIISSEKMLQNKNINQASHKRRARYACTQHISAKGNPYIHVCSCPWKGSQMDRWGYIDTFRRHEYFRRVLLPNGIKDRNQTKVRPNNDFPVSCFFSCLRQKVAEYSGRNASTSFSWERLVIQTSSWRQKLRCVSREAIRGSDGHIPLESRIYRRTNKKCSQNIKGKSVCLKLKDKRI
jgi:hypothetical protein